MGERDVWGSKLLVPWSNETPLWEDGHPTLAEGVEWG